MQSTSSPGDSPTTAGPNNDQYKVVRKRNRIPLSCAPCRARKLKCNRSTPCENCIKRGEAAACSYAPPSARKKTSAKSQAASTPDDMQNRIDKLEGLVLSLMNSGSDSVSPTANRAMSTSTSSNSQTPFTPQDSDIAQREDSVESETDRVAKSFGVLHFNNNQASYIGDSHWATILHGISEVKNYFKEHQKQYEEALNTVEASRREAGIQATGPVFLLAGRNPPDFKELVNRLPRRTEVDQLVRRYFDDFDPSIRILHLPTWHQEYDRYWQNPGGSDASFLGQLYAICGLAMQSYFKNQDEPYEYQGRSQDLSVMYRGLTQQCLQLVDYSKIEQTTIETLILHLHAEYQKTGEADIGLWVLSRMVISLAMRAGIHRDGKNFPGISPFQCEMRRRLWTFLRTLDALLSFSVGLPSMIRECDTDAELPSNLKDNDFHQDIETMPPSRSRNELTEVSYLIAKAELTYAFQRITTLVTGTAAISYDQVVSLNDELRDIYNGLFPTLQVRETEDLQTDVNDMFMMRLNLSILYNKGLCVLHRKYLSLSRENPRYSPSRQACIDASLALLRNQRMIDREMQAGGRMHRSQLNVAMLSIATLMQHDFILASTLVALDLLASVQAEAAGRSSGDIDVWGIDRKEEQMQALESARVIWDGLRGRYVEAYKAYSICGVMIQKIQQCWQQIRVQQVAQGAVQYAAASTTVGQNGGVHDTSMVKPEHSAAMSLGMLSGATQNTLSGPQSNVAVAMNGGLMETGMTPNFPMDSLSPGNSFPFLSGVGGAASANMDWNAWDEYMQNPNLDADIWPQSFDFNIPTTFDTNQLPNGDQSVTSQLDANMFANPTPQHHSGSGA